jgi:hypothetical protein
MISQATMLALEKEDLSYILGVRMRLVKEVRTEVPLDDAPYEEVYPWMKKMKKELDYRLVSQGLQLEWADIKQDLKALQEVILQENGSTLAVRTECQGTCGKVFKATGVAVPPTIRVAQP